VHQNVVLPLLLLIVTYEREMLTQHLLITEKMSSTQVLALEKNITALKPFRRISEVF